MGRLRSVSLILILGAWGGATAGAASDDAAAAPSTATRQAPPAPPIKYLEAGAKLFNTEKFELASKYLEAANRYRDQLQPDEQKMLDAYLVELAKVDHGAFVSTSTKTASARTQDAAAVPVAAAAPAVAAAPVSVAAPATATAAPAVPVAANPAAVPANPAEAKQRGRWLLHQGREQLMRGNYDSAQQKVEEVRALDIHWGLFDDTPDKLEKDVVKARPTPAPAMSTAETKVPHDRRTAKAKLIQARALLNSRQYEQAEAIALDVKGWGLSYSMFDDNPDKVAAAARALRHREEVRNRPARVQSSQALYDELVKSSRQLLKAGRLDEADHSARQALAMDVYPGLNADRAENVLHDIEMARANTRLMAPAAPAMPSTLPVQAEVGTTAVAAAQPDQTSAGMPLAAAPAAPVSDPAVRKIAAAVPDGGPELAAPADDKTNATAAGSPPQVAAASPAPEEPAPAPVSEAPAPAQAPAGNRGEQLLAEAKALYASGNFAGAREMAAQAKAGNFGVDAQADELIAQIGIAEQGGALALYEEALTAIRKGDASRARALLTEVAASGDSLDQGLRTKVNGLLEKLAHSKGGQPGTATTVDAVQDAETIKAQKLNAEVGTKIAEARRYHEVDPDRALAMYQQAIQAVQGSGLPPELTRPMVRRLEVATELAKKDKTVYLVKMADKKQREEIELKRLRILEADGAKKARVTEYMEKGMAAFAEGKYVEAETYAKKAMEVDPNEVTAPILAFKARMQRRFNTNKQIADAKENAFVETFQAVDRASTPADALLDSRGIEFAHDFKDLTRERRDLMRRLQERKDPKVVAIESKLKEPVTLNIDKQPLSDAIKFLQDYTGLNIVADTRGLADEGLSLNSPVTLNVNNIQIKSALNLMLRPLGLTYKIENEVVLITSPQANPADTYVKTYYVGDLLIPAGKSPGDTMPTDVFNVDKTGSQTAPRLMGNGFATADTMAAAEQAQGGSGMKVVKGDRRWVDMTPLVQLIATSIAPGTWHVNDANGADITQSYGLGGGFGGDAGDIPTRPIGAITPFFLSISLIIRHTAEVHDQVADLLRQLRRLQDLQVSIEVRFITVQDNFFEQIGVDFDFQIQSDTVGKHSTFAVPNFTGFPLTTPGTVITTTTTSTSTSSSTATGGATAGGTTGGATGGGTTGGATGGGTTGGATGGGTTGGATGGGTTGGATAGGTTGGATSGVTQTPPYLVNPIRDHALGSNTPVIVGTQGGGIANFSPNLDMPFTNTTASLIAPTFVNNYQPNGGATFGIAFLSDLEVYLFLTAAQGDTRSNVLSAPKVTTFNGAAATIISGTLIYYVSSIQPIIGPGAVAYTPNVSAITSGVVLAVTPVVSADRRYVRMTLTPTFQTVNGFTTYSAQTGAVGGSGLGGGAATITGQIQLPNTTTNVITTTVTVPDGGTVLMGGVKTLLEQRIEYGVPVLSKTPLIDRLFRNVGIGRNSQSLMIMVSPHIIILEEEEERLGIPSVQM